MVVIKIGIPIVKTIKKRTSIRTYDERKLTDFDKEKLIKFFNELSNPFGEKIKIYLTEKMVDGNGKKLGTYGVVKGANSFLGASVASTEFGLEALGYEFENLILYATHIGLGTVWLGATFSRNSFATAMGVNDTELFPVISAVGYPAGKKNLKDLVMRKVMKSDKRKSWDKLFFNNNFSTPLIEKEAGFYKIPLKMLRLAPSATNAQPWGILKVDNVIHFYMSHNINANESEKMIKRVDLGIGISHFHQTALEYGLVGSFQKCSQESIEIPENMKYVISWIEKTNY